MEKFGETFNEKMSIQNSFVRELLAEFLGTFFLLLIGTSANVQQAMGGNSTSAHIAWGIGFAFAVYLAYNVSGAHLNPAISLSAFLLNGLSFPRLVAYSIVQLIGAFCGTAIAFLGHLDDINNLDGGVRSTTGTASTAGLFTTFPASHMTIVGSFFDQVIGTAILASLISLVTDRRHRIPGAVQPALIGSTMTMIAMTFGANGGFAINPARDLGPRLFTLIVGYGWEVFSQDNFYFWIPIVGPYVGAVLGTVIYKMFIGLHGLNEEVPISGNASQVSKEYRVSPGKHSR